MAARYARDVDHNIDNEDYLMDPVSAVLVTFGAIMILAGWVQLLFTSFEDDYTWGLTTVFLPVLSYIYCFFSWEKAKGAMGLTIIGWILVVFGIL